MSWAFTCFMVDELSDCWYTDGAPRVGAMVWRNHESPTYDSDPRPLPHLVVMTPAGLFCIDCSATDPPHGHWERRGEPPIVTVTPSININREAWHGWLTNGVLV